MPRAHHFRKRFPASGPPRMSEPNGCRTQDSTTMRIAASRASVAIQKRRPARKRATSCSPEWLPARRVTHPARATPIRDVRNVTATTTGRRARRSRRNSRCLDGALEANDATCFSTVPFRKPCRPMPDCRASQRPTMAIIGSGYRKPAAAPCGATSSIRFRSLRVSLMLRAPAFSSRYFRRLVPGMGRMS